MARVGKTLAALLLLFAAVILATVHCTAVTVLLLWALHFVVLKVAPLFKGQENLWMFTLVAFTALPLNLLLLQTAGMRAFLFDTWAVLGIVRCIVAYAVLLSAEETLMGVLTAALFRR